MEESMPDAGQNRLQPMGRQNISQSNRSAAPWRRQEPLVAVRGGYCWGQAGNSLWSWGSTPKGVRLWGDCEWLHTRAGISHGTAAMREPCWGRYTLVGLWSWVTHIRAGKSLRDCGHSQPTLQQGHSWGAVAMGDPCWGRDTEKQKWKRETIKTQEVEESQGSAEGNHYTYDPDLPAELVASPKGLGWAECNPQRKWGKLRLWRERIRVWLKLSLEKEEKKVFT